MQTAAHTRSVWAHYNVALQCANADKSGAFTCRCVIDPAAHITLQASLTAKLAGRYGSSVEVQKSGALLLAGNETVSTQLQLDSYGQLIGCGCSSMRRPPVLDQVS